MFKRMLKKIIPRSVLLFYHKVLAVAANVAYWFPSHRMVIVGVTGTKGKSTTVLMITRILEEAGYTVGSTNTIFFNDGKKEWPNVLKQGMPGRFYLQKLLRRMVRHGCTHAVIEVTSEGILQHRQWGVAFDVAVFTNLSPEHIGSHGSYESYRSAKAHIFRSLDQSRRKRFNGLPVKKAIIVNNDEKDAQHFSRHRSDELWLVNERCGSHAPDGAARAVCAEDMDDTSDGVAFTYDDHYIQLALHGTFMAMNALLAIAATRSLGVSTSTAEQALEAIEKIPGRVEYVTCGQKFTVIVDYAHEPRSFKKIMALGRELAGEHNLVVVFGATGGGRDAKKRPEMGRIAAEKANVVILTTDDPYDDDPGDLIGDIAVGVLGAGERTKEGKTFFKIVDRKKAIQSALSGAAPGDVVLVLGKGSEQTMVLRDGKTVPWNDVAVIKQLLKA